MKRSVIAGTPAAPVAPSRGRLRPLGHREVQITDGFWAAMQQLNRDSIIPHCDRSLERVGWVVSIK